MRKHLLKLFLFTAIAVLLLTAAAAWIVLAPVALKGEQVDFTIVPGSSMRVAARELAAAGVELEPWVLILLGKLMRVDTSIKAGSYEILAGITPLELLKKLTRGDVTQAEVAFIEGWTFRQMRERIDAHPDLRHDTQDLPEAEIMRLIGAPEEVAEGLFFPDTYFFAKRSSDVDLLARAYRSMQQHLARAWQERAAELPYEEPYQALIMASIVEKETGRADDRPLVAGVFVNRLRQGMLLQTDPTVIYGIGESFDGNLRKRDLRTDTPYNTYTRPGLPPTPIAMPGLASLQAALHPPPTEALYFVARGDGSSQFSPTLDEHNRAVRRFQKGGRP
ncbi:MAG: putative aminodeoxychorismate lyase [Candidatus Accumulibacter appositus]|uniref:Endolytic murein transglycosylase n=1 Tax=Candidatus Accumulibacter appositus TaxID=1454003 RepID=A0A011P3K7_9PROT|nr:endolytic transglycosylase MltG [Accumulibacter sp.]EXI82201.1 MAG: putative aminodeoxychorismate lyase [Candidatus Accumulibacter appositus]HRF04466.1 endolytic transglycosylase MltG [Accumulibacter sp.]